MCVRERERERVCVCARACSLMQCIVETGHEGYVNVCVWRVGGVGERKGEGGGLSGREAK